MNARGLTYMLVVAGAAGLWGRVSASPNASVKAPLPKRMELFVGGGTASWLPKTSILPTASDIEASARKLSSRVRNMDPFGLPTFPREEDLKAPEIQVERGAERITLNQALQSLHVTGINLDKKEILFRGRNVFQGDVMVLSFKDQIFLAQLVEVGATEIQFRDLKRQETGVLPHSLVPHLELEPVRTDRSGLEGKVTPMESTKPLQQ